MPATAAICWTISAPSPMPRYAGASWIITGSVDGRCDASEVVDERRLVEHAAHRSGHHDAARARPLGVAGELDGGPAARRADPDEDRHGTGHFLEDDVRQLPALVGRELEHFTGQTEGDDAVGAAVERKADDASLRLEVDVVVIGKRRADRRIHASPCVKRRYRNPPRERRSDAR